MTWWRRCVDLRIILYLKVAVGAKQCQFQDITFDKNPCSLSSARVIIKTHRHFPLFLAAAPLADCKKTTAAPRANGSVVRERR